MARRNVHLTCRYLLILFSLYAFLSSAVQAQVRFIQITDPHIFDDVGEARDDRLDDKAILASCINKINQLVAEQGGDENVEPGKVYNFVVVTGDLGIEQLLRGTEVEKDRVERLRKGAADLASMLVLSKVRRWLFVPGNNDLLKEQPESIRYYHMFITALDQAVKEAAREVAGEAGTEVKENFEIKDLCPKDKAETGGQYGSQADASRIGDYAFIGFNDSSFKNSATESEGSSPPVKASPNSPIETNAITQKRYISQVADMLLRDDIKFAYIFYHIPEIDDPYLVTLAPEQEPLRTRFANKELTGGSFMYSAWFVRHDVRNEWNKVVMNPKVRGLFAGHFHDYKRKTYQGFQWMLTRDYFYQSLEKLHVCPPLALKLQGDKPEQARGFQEVYLDKEGNVSARIFWLNRDGWNLGEDAAGADAQALRQLELGQKFESLDRLKEAEAAYTKAAESNWPPTRQRALRLLEGVVHKQASVYESFRPPLRAAGTALLTVLLTLFLGILLIVPTHLLATQLLLRPVEWYAAWMGRDKLAVGPIVDTRKGDAGARFEQIVALVHARIQTHFKPRPPIGGQLGIGGQPIKLPMLVSSQSADTAELIEALAPGSVGKSLAWLLKKMDRPRYSISGVIQHVRPFRSIIFISLHEKGESLKSWDKTAPADTLIVDEKKLAFDALKRLVRHVNR